MSSGALSPSASLNQIDDSQSDVIDEQLEEDKQVVDDNAAHAAAAAASKPKPRKRKATAATSSAASSKKAKLGKWQHAEDLGLLEAVKQFVIANKGQLPGPVRTVASAVCTKPWIAIAKAVSKVNELSPDAAGKACSARWTALRISAKVRQTCAMANTVLAVG